MSHRISDSLIRVDRERGIIKYGKNGRQVVCHLEVSWKEFLDHQTKVIDTLNRIYWTDGLENVLPVHILFTGKDYFPDMRQSDRKRLLVNRAIGLAEKSKLVEHFA
jgi:hypothetical protein